MYIPWLLAAVKRWKSLSKCVKVFCLRLAGLASSLKPGMKALFESGLFKTLRICVKSDYPDPSILLGYADCLYFILENDVTCNRILDLCMYFSYVYHHLFMCIMYHRITGSLMKYFTVCSFVIKLIHNTVVSAYCGLLTKSNSWDKGIDI